MRNQASLKNVFQRFDVRNPQTFHHNEGGSTVFSCFSRLARKSEETKKKAATELTSLLEKNEIFENVETWFPECCRVFAIIAVTSIDQEIRDPLNAALSVSLRKIVQEGKSEIYADELDSISPVIWFSRFCVIEELRRGVEDLFKLIKDFSKVELFLKRVLSCDESQFSSNYLCTSHKVYLFAISSCISSLVSLYEFNIINFESLQIYFNPNERFYLLKHSKIIPQQLLIELTRLFQLFPTQQDQVTPFICHKQLCKWMNDLFHTQPWIYEEVPEFFIAFVSRYTVDIKYYNSYLKGILKCLEDKLQTKIFDSLPKMLSIIPKDILLGSKSFLEELPSVILTRFASSSVNSTVCFYQTIIYLLEKRLNQDSSMLHSFITQFFWRPLDLMFDSLLLKDYKIIPFGNIDDDLFTTFNWALNQVIQRKLLPSLVAQLLKDKILVSIGKSLEVFTKLEFHKITLFIRAMENSHPLLISPIISDTMASLLTNGMLGAARIFVDELKLRKDAILSAFKADSVEEAFLHFAKSVSIQEEEEDDSVGFFVHCLINFLPEVKYNDEFINRLCAVKEGQIEWLTNLIPLFVRHPSEVEPKIISGLLITSKNLALGLYKQYVKKVENDAVQISRIHQIATEELFPILDKDLTRQVFLTLLPTLKKGGSTNSDNFDINGIALDVITSDLHSFSEKKEFVSSYLNNVDEGDKLGLIRLLLKQGVSNAIRPAWWGIMKFFFNEKKHLMILGVPQLFWTCVTEAWDVMDSVTSTRFNELFSVCCSNFDHTPSEKGTTTTNEVVESWILQLLRIGLENEDDILIDFISSELIRRFSLEFDNSSLFVNCLKKTLTSDAYLEVVSTLRSLLDIKDDKTYWKLACEAANCESSIDLFMRGHLNLLLFSSDNAPFKHLAVQQLLHGCEVNDIQEVIPMVKLLKYDNDEILLKSLEIFIDNSNFSRLFELCLNNHNLVIPPDLFLVSCGKMDNSKKSMAGLIRSLPRTLNSFGSVDDLIDSSLNKLIENASSIPERNVDFDLFCNTVMIYCTNRIFNQLELLLSVSCPLKMKNSIYKAMVTTRIPLIREPLLLRDTDIDSVVTNLIDHHSEPNYGAPLPNNNDYWDKIVCLLLGDFFGQCVLNTSTLLDSTLTNIVDNSKIENIEDLNNVLCAWIVILTSLTNKKNSDNENFDLSCILDFSSIYFSSKEIYEDIEKNIDSKYHAATCFPMKTTPSTSLFTEMKPVECIIELAALLLISIQDMDGYKEFNEQHLNSYSFLLPGYDGLWINSIRVIMLIGDLFPIYLRKFLSLEGSIFMNKKCFLWLERIFMTGITSTCCKNEVDTIRATLLSFPEVSTKYDARSRTLNMKIVSQCLEFNLTATAQFPSSFPMKPPILQIVESCGIPKQTLQSWLFKSRLILLGTAVPDSEKLPATNSRIDDDDKWDHESISSASSSQELDKNKNAIFKSIGTGVGTTLDVLKYLLRSFFALVDKQVPCYICFSVVHSRYRSLPKTVCKTCKNAFHSECLQRWFARGSNKCPLCLTVFI